MTNLPEVEVKPEVKWLYTVGLCLHYNLHFWLYFSFTGYAYSHQPEPQRPPIHQCRPWICQGDGRARLPFDSRNENRPRDSLSRQLVAYIVAFLPTARYVKSNDGQISAVCDDQYSSMLAMLKEPADEAFKVYMTSKTQGWFLGWRFALGWSCLALGCLDV